MGGLLAAMSAEELAEKYGLPEIQLQDALNLCAGILNLDKRPTTKERLRQLKRERKKHPDNENILWAEEFRLKAGQRKVTLNTKTCEITIEQNHGHRKNSNRTDRRLDIAVLSLHDLWCRYNNGRFSRYEDGASMQFLADALRLLDVHATHLSGRALRSRLQKIYRKLDVVKENRRQEKSEDRRKLLQQKLVKRRLVRQAKNQE